MQSRKSESTGTCINLKPQVHAACGMQEKPTLGEVIDQIGLGPAQMLCQVSWCSKLRQRLMIFFLAQVPASQLVACNPVTAWLAQQRRTMGMPAGIVIRLAFRMFTNSGFAQASWVAEFGLQMAPSYC